MVYYRMQLPKTRKGVLTKFKALQIQMSKLDVNFPVNTDMGAFAATAVYLLKFPKAGLYEVAHWACKVGICNVHPYSFGFARGQVQYYHGLLVDALIADLSKDLALIEV